MTARKVHFDFNAEGTHAFCGATPRDNAPALELSERRKDVDCAKCLKAMAEYDAEQNTVTDDLVTKLQAETIAMDAPAPWEPLHQEIADRHGLKFLDVANGFKAGYLKR